MELTIELSEDEIKSAIKEYLYGIGYEIVESPSQYPENCNISLIKTGFDDDQRDPVKIVAYCKVKPKEKER